MTSILLIRLSSMGDLIHTYPALSDVLQHFPEAQIDWVSEEGFAQLPQLHPAVKNTLPMAWRRWRRSLWRKETRAEISTFRQQLKAKTYDWVIDSQGLVKSGAVALGAKGLRAGFDRRSARESLASCAYHKTFAVARGQHAVWRNRELFGRILGYTPEGPANFGLNPTVPLPDWLPNGAYAVLLHATSREDKEWPVAHWVTVGQALAARGLNLVIPWGSQREQQRSQLLASQLPNCIVPPARLSLDQAATLLKQAQLTIGVDTGLTHLANAVDCPLIAIYTVTDPGLTGVTAGPRAINLGGRDGGPTPEQVLQQAQPWLAK